MFEALVIICGLLTNTCADGVFEGRFFETSAECRAVLPLLIEHTMWFAREHMPNEPLGIWGGCVPVDGMPPELNNDDAISEERGA